MRSYKDSHLETSNTLTARQESNPESVGTKSGRAAQTYFPEFDGLRGFAAVSVVVFHYISMSRNASPVVAMVQTALYLSPGSVDMFFILSGFLIGTILLRNQNAPNYYKVFYMRRTYRILPLYYGWLALFFVFFFLAPGWGIVHPAAYGSAGIVGIYLAMLQNNIPAVLDGSIWMGTSWTLGVEEPFYVLVPVCFRMRSRKMMAWVFGGVVVASSLFPVLVEALFAHGAAWGGQAGYFWTPSRIGTPALGCLLALAWATPEIQSWIRRNVRLFYWGMLVLAPMAFFLENASAWNIRHGFLLRVLFERDALVFSALCLVAAVLAHPEGRLAAAMRWRWLRRFGTISYGMYLMHWGIMWFIFRFILHREINPKSFLAIELLPVCFLVTWGVAELSWKFFESPLVQRGQAHKYMPASAAKSVSEPTFATQENCLMDTRTPDPEAIQ